MDTTNTETHHRDPVTGKLLCGRAGGRSLEPWPPRTIREVIIKDITCPECQALMPVATPEQIKAGYTTNMAEKMMADDLL